MKDIDLNKLKELSERVNYGGFTVGDSGYRVESSSGYFADCLGMDEASFIYAANPAVVIALIEQLEAAQRERDEWREESRKSFFLYCAMETRAEAAEAQVKELTANLDKESEIRHRIHEELNAIKGEQQSVKQLNIAGEHWMDVSPQKYRELSEERATVRTLYTHPAPAVLPKLVDSESICNVEGLGWIKNLDADECQCCAEVYNQAIADAKALGAKPLPTIVLTAGALKPDGRIWYTSETVEALIRAAGLEVKS